MANKNNNLNFDKLAVNALRVIDSIRSRSKFGNIIPAESRVNAFYRALGLPAVVRPRDEEDEEERDPGNIANVFPNDQLSFKTYGPSLNARESRSIVRFTEEDSSRFLSFNNAKFSNSVSDTQTLGRLPLKPFLVLGEVPIFPQNRRVGGAFLSNEKLTKGKIQYKRPLIETIILMKLKGVGVVDTSKQSRVLPGVTGQLRALIDILSENLRLSLIATPNLLKKSINELQGAQKQTKLDVAAEFIAEQNPVTRVSDDEEEDLGELDKQDINLQFSRALNESLLGLFEFDDTFGDGVNNMKAGLLASEVLLSSATVVEEEGAEEENKRDVEEKKKSANKKIKESYRTISLLLGTFTGLSGVDIIAVITAMMEMDVEFLIGLLNNDAKDELRKIKGNDVVNSASSVRDALDELESKVQTIMNNLDGQLAEDNLDRQQVNQESRKQQTNQESRGE